MRRRAGFTLIEVMVAIAILAISLSAIFSTEAGAARMAHRARKVGIASLLARCKMGEIEEQVAAEGLPALFDSGSDECCVDAEVEGYSCDWEIHPVVLPDAMFGTEEEGVLATDGDPTTGAAPSGEPGAASSPFGDLAQTQPRDLLAGGAELDGIASMALQQVYPVLKPSFESQIRRATVTVRWKEGDVDHDFDVTQYLVAEEPVQVLADDQAADPGATGTGTPSPTGTGP